jgi:hypothetical protein
MPDWPPPSHDLSAADESASLMPEGLAQSHGLTPDGPPPSPPSLPTETLLDNAEILDKNVMKKAGIVSGVVIAGGTIAGIVASEIKHHEHRDIPDSGYASASSVPSRHFDNLSQK